MLPAQHAQDVLAEPEDRVPSIRSREDGEFQDVAVLHQEQGLDVLIDPVGQSPALFDVNRRRAVDL